MSRIERLTVKISLNRPKSIMKSMRIIPKSSLQRPTLKAAAYSCAITQTRISPWSQQIMRRMASSLSSASLSSASLSSASLSSASLSSASLSSLPLLEVQEEVQDALFYQKPIVALESTIVAHGMPFPQNLELALKVESILRSKGVVPATIALKNSKCRVGLDPEELEDLAKAGQDGRAQKCSTRELSLFLATQLHRAQKELQSQQRQQQPSGISTAGYPSEQQQEKEEQSRVIWGATTVASTMVLANLAGISTFVTGGIGGVHRNGHITMDISADLLELSRTPVLVVSAGIKSILDIGKTLEMLETNGVPTIVYSSGSSDELCNSDEFPSFYSPHSGIPAECRMDDAKVIAAAYGAARHLNLSHGMLVAVPNHDPAGASVEQAIQQALMEADQQNIHGKGVTPFLLKRVAELTGGDSLRSNMALVQRNASVGADIAIAIAEQERQLLRPVGPFFETNSLSQSSSPRSKVVIVGGIVHDIVARPTPGQKLILGTSNPGQCDESDGGVGRNLAEALGRLGSQPVLYSAVGKDDRGQTLLERLQWECGVVGVDETVRVVDGSNTATFLALLNDHGDLHTACADMAVLAKIEPPPDHVLRQAKIVVFDANPSVQLLRDTAQRAVALGAKVAFEPTSVPKAQTVAQDDLFLSCLTYAFPNYDELVAMVTTSVSGITAPDSAATDEGELYFEHIQTLAAKLLQKMKEESHVLVTLGDKGALLCSRTGSQMVRFQHFPAPTDIMVRNTTGAGDSMCAGFLHAILNGHDEHEAVLMGMKAASLSLQCAERTIAPNLADIL